MANKKYKKGMTDAAKAYFAFGSKQENALEHILHEVRDRNDMLDENVTNLYQYLQSNEKATLYSVYTPNDIADMEAEEKLFLLGALITLTTDKTPTIEQQKFIRAIRKYLDITDIPDSVELTNVENIESLNVQKAIYQVVLEYLILQDGENYAETELQEEFLSSFSLNEKARQTIANHVEILFAATGAEGITEKYGYVAEESTVTVIDDTAIEATEKERQAVLLALEFGFSPAQYYDAIPLSDYLWICGGYVEEQHAIINIITGESDSINWLNIKPTSNYVVCGNQCCVEYDHAIYFIDFENKTTKKIVAFETKTSITVIGMNTEYIVLYTGETKLYKISEGTTEDVACCGDSVIFEDNCIYFVDQGQIQKYNLTSKTTEKIFSIDAIKSDEIKKRFGGRSYEGQGCIVDSLIYNNRFYVLGVFDGKYSAKRHYIYSFDLFDKNNYKLEADNIIVDQEDFVHQQKTIVKHESGWLFVTEKNETDVEMHPAYILKIFDCITNQITEIATNCGYTGIITSGVLIKKIKLLLHPSSAIKWGNYVFYGHGINQMQTRPACIAIDKPMEVIFISK